MSVRARADRAAPDEAPEHLWVDGALVRRAAGAPDPAVLEAGLCYTTALVRGGEPVWPARHAARLARDAARHALEPPDAETVVEALRALSRAEFGAGDGIVRLQLGLDREGVSHLVGVPRPVGDDPPVWRLGSSPVTHPGPESRGGAKLLGLSFVDDTRSWLAASGYDEAVLFDAAGRVVEGSRSNLIVVDRGGRPCFADRALGGVAGLGLEVSCECIPDLAPACLTRGDLAQAREIVAVNAVRGARPCVELDGVPVGDGAPGELAAALSAALERA